MQTSEKSCRTGFVSAICFRLLAKKSPLIPLNSYTNPSDDVKRINRVSIDGGFEYVISKNWEARRPGCIDIFIKQLNEAPS